MQCLSHMTDCLPRAEKFISAEGNEETRRAYGNARRDQQHGLRGLQEVFLVVRGPGMPIDDELDKIVSNEEEDDEKDSEWYAISAYFPRFNDFPLEGP